MFLLYGRSNTGQHRITRPGLWRMSVSSFSVLISSGTCTLIIHALGPRDTGIYMFVQWLAGIAVPAVGVGMSSLTSRHIAALQSHETPRMAAGIFYFIWKRQWRSILLYGALYLLLALPLSHIYGAQAPFLFLLLASVSALPLLLSSVVSIALRSLHHINLLAALHLFNALLTLLLVTLAGQVRGEHIPLFLLATTLSGIVTLIIGILCVLRFLPLQRAFRLGPLLQERLALNLHHPLVLFLLDAIIWQPGALLLLALWYSPSIVGFYALSAMISTQLVELAPTLLYACLLPFLSRYMLHRHYANTYDAFRKTSFYVAVLALPMCMIAMIFCPLLLSACLGIAYLPVVTPLRILLVATIFSSIATVSLTHLTHTRNKRTQLWLGLWVAILHGGLVYPFVLRWGMTGAALASTIAQMASAIGSIILCRNYLKTCIDEGNAL